MLFEIVEKQLRHDVWGTYIRLTLPDTADVGRKYADLMKILGKYVVQPTVVKRNGVEVKI